MPHALLISLALAAAATATPLPPVAAASTPAVSETTAAAAPAAGGTDNLWLVAPLYPGQELLISRTEAAIHKLLPEGSTDLVGEAALVKLSQSRKGDLACALGEKTCKNPIDDYMRAMGLSKILLIKGGQEEPNYVYQVTALDLVTGEQRASNGTANNLEKALLAALVKVAPLASSLDVTVSPGEAEVFILVAAPSVDEQKPRHGRFGRQERAGQPLSVDRQSNAPFIDLFRRDHAVLVTYFVIGPTFGSTPRK